MSTKKTKVVEAGGIYLTGYMERVINQLKEDRKFSAARIYRCVLHSYQNFAGGSGVPLPMEEVFTPARLKAYEEWMTQKKKRPLKANSVTSYLSTLRAVYHRWIPAGTPGYNPKMFADVHIRVVSQTKRALHSWQMDKLRKADTSEFTAEQKKTLSCFNLMFVCRGMPYIDLAYMRKQDLQGDCLVYLRHKTGIPMSVKLSDEALRLIRELGKKNPDSPYLLPILNADALGGWEQYVQYQKALRGFNRTLQQVTKRLLPGVRVSSYTARHTWATIAYHLGKPVGIISQALGHSSIGVTMTYLKPFDGDMIDKVNRQVTSFEKNPKRKKCMTPKACETFC